jgi:putative ABC transport system permease protein
MRDIPGRAARTILRLFLTGTAADAVLGDLLEEQIQNKRSRAWVFLQAVRIAWQCALNIRALLAPTHALNLDNESEPIMETLTQDVRYALRSLRRRLGFSVLAMLTLALGLGGATATFTLVDSILLRPLPYRDADRLVEFSPTRPQDGQPTAWSLPEWNAVTSAQSVFEAMGTFAPRTTSFLVTEGSQPEVITAARASGGFFQTLGVAPERGRLFSSEDERPEEQQTVILSHSFWQHNLGGDPAILGKSLQLDSLRAVSGYTVIGILPGDFHFNPDVSSTTPAAATAAATEPQVWLPLRIRPVDATPNNHTFRAIGRLKSGATVDQARAQLESVVAQAAHPHGAHVITRQEQETGKTRGSLWILFGAAGLVLLIACGNVGNLLLGEATAREHEIAVRRSLGAGRIRILRQLLTESVVLSLGAGVLGLLLAKFAIGLIVGGAPYAIPRLHEIGIDLRVFAFMFAIALGTGVIFGLGPATALLRSSTKIAPKEESTRVSRRSRLSSAIVIAEIALSFVLLVSAGLLTQTLIRLAWTPTGFDSRNLLVVALRLPANAYTEKRTLPLFDRIEERLQGLPGVRTVSSASVVPFEGKINSTWVYTETMASLPADKRPVALQRTVASNYLETLGIPLVAGRGLTRQDEAEGSDAIIVNQTMAHKLWPGQNAIGRRVYLDATRSYRVVGVAGDAKNESLGAAAESTFYLAYSNISADKVFLVRTEGDASNLANSVKAAIWEIEKGAAFTRLETMNSMVSTSIATERYRVWLIGIFATLAGVLAAIGLYGVVSRSVLRRTRELGIRIALGAQQSDITRLVLGQSALLTISGIVLGAAGAAASSQVLRSVLFGVTPLDPLTYTGIALLLVAVAALASYFPLRRASRVDPIDALRAE